MKFSEIINEETPKNIENTQLLADIAKNVGDLKAILKDVDDPMEYFKNMKLKEGKVFLKKLRALVDHLMKI